ncbi:MAG: radical SAM protein, partial [Candidatus Omnitrophica bacterium]|nr:radical SAM protein [Candidatus Omnitrophota bacterium]
MDKRNYLNDVKLELTSACNKDCSFCYLKTRKKRLDTPYTKNELFSIVDKLHKQNILNVRLSGGEPLMYENLEELLGYLKKKQFRVGLVTNGELITDRFLKDSRGRIDYLCVSFHQLKNRKIIDRLERHDVAYSLNTILSASNVRLLDKFHKFVAGLSRARSWNLLRELLFAGI